MAKSKDDEFDTSDDVVTFEGRAKGAGKWNVGVAVHHARLVVACHLNALFEERPRSTRDEAEAEVERRLDALRRASEGTEAWIEAFYERWDQVKGVELVGSEEEFLSEYVRFMGEMEEGRVRLSEEFGLLGLDSEGEEVAGGGEDYEGEYGTGEETLVDEYVGKEENDDGEDEQETVVGSTSLKSEWQEGDDEDSEDQDEDEEEDIEREKIIAIMRGEISTEMCGENNVVAW